jgi:hypothetical protein
MGKRSEARDMPYTEDKVAYIRYVYIVGLIVWVGLVYYLGMHHTDYVGWIILSIPIWAFILGYVNTCVISGEVEAEVFQANYLSIGLLIVLPLLTWINREYNGDRRRFTSILVLAIIIIMLSMIDLWVPCEWLSVVKHGKSVLQTLALVLLIYALYMYYVSAPHSVLQ